jgi:hypothetical protein
VDETKWTERLGTLLVCYVFIIGLVGVAFIVANFPHVDSAGIVKSHPKWLKSIDQTLLLLVIAAGITGSFIHAAQSLTSYLGNKEFKTSWTAWYLLRPWVGGVLALAMYFAFRAGLVAGASTVNPYGVVAIGLLGGWFSKTTTDKLQEVFETLFKTDEDKKRKDKLHGAEQPVITSIDPNPVPADHNQITVRGDHFREGAVVRIGANQLPATFVSVNEVTVSLANFANRPAAGSTVLVQVMNPEGEQPLSVYMKLRFQ